MPKTRVFDEHDEAYDRWFETHRDVYEAEIEVIRDLLPATAGEGLEVGVGSGRFAAPLGIRTGVEPSAKMAARARSRGVQVCAGVAERLPFPDDVFDVVLMVTTVCFVDDVPRCFRESSRVLRTGGEFIVGFIDRESALGRQYEERKGTSRFYGDAVFFTAREIVRHLRDAGFEITTIRQALLPGAPPTVIRDGHGQGAFVAVKARK